MQKTKIDLLFVLATDPGAPQNNPLQVQMLFPYLLQVIDFFPQEHLASYHVGVITSDLGAGPYSLENGACHPGGDGARLQAVGVAALSGCQMPTGGLNFIDYNELDGTNNLPAGWNVDSTFECAASVGYAGCSFSQPLEAAYLALHDPIPENAGFLRDDALLVVIFVMDQDDCSFPTDSDLADPSPAGVAAYGPQPDFRCTQFGIACGDPPTPVQPVASNGPLSMCRPLTMAEGGKLIDVQKYVDYLTLPAPMGGVKADPRDVIVALLGPPAGPVSVSESPCGPNPQSPSCPYLDGICGGMPTVRLSAALQMANALLISDCDGDYMGAMQQLGALILPRIP
jgi:hypothetical protein